MNPLNAHQAAFLAAGSFACYLLWDWDGVLVFLAMDACFVLGAKAMWWVVTHALAHRGEEYWVKFLTRLDAAVERRRDRG